MTLAEREAHLVKHHVNPDSACGLCKSHAELVGMSQDQLVGLVELLRRELEVAWKVANRLEEAFRKRA